MTKYPKSIHNIYCLTIIKVPYNIEKQLLHYNLLKANKNQQDPNQQQTLIQFIYHIEHFGV